MYVYTIYADAYKRNPSATISVRKKHKVIQVSKNVIGPQPRNLEGGIQELLTTTMQAFELLRNNFERLVDLKMTQMDE